MSLGPDDFAGDWRVRRVIDDRRAGQAGLFSGIARFAPEVGGLRYREEGTLRLGGGPPMAASRDYLWDWDAGEVRILFADGRPFHRFVPAGCGAGTDHPCGPDLYRVTYDFRAWPAWTSDWKVEGPRKSYRMTTTYARPRELAR